MKAAWYSRNGEAQDVMVLGDLPKPSVQAGEVLVRLVTSGVNPSDVKSRRARPVTDPLIVPHSDGAGVIEAVGEGVPAARVGERVWIWNGQWQRPCGTCADYIAVRKTYFDTLKGGDIAVAAQQLDSALLPAANRYTDTMVELQKYQRELVTVAVAASSTDGEHAAKAATKPALSTQRERVSSLLRSMWISFFLGSSRESG